MTAPRIGLAISGGGFRATAFGLGCLRALHDRGVLDNVTVVSGISGGSLAAALWAYGPARFDDFDAHTVDLLRRGIQLDITRRAVTPIGRRPQPDRCPRVRAAQAVQPPAHRQPHRRATRHPRQLAFGDMLVDQVTHPGLATVISATDLITTRAVRFGSHRSSCSAHGTISRTDHRRPGRRRQRRLPAPAARGRTNLHLHPNAGTAPQPPPPIGSRSPTAASTTTSASPCSNRDAHPRHTTTSTTSTTSSPATPEPATEPATGRFLPTRLHRSFNITYRKTQDAGRAASTKPHAPAKSAASSTATSGCPTNGYRPRFRPHPLRQGPALRHQLQSHEP